MAGLTADRLDGLFAAIDAKDTDGFLEYLTEGCVFRFGSSPEARGHAQIRDGVDGFFSGIAGSTHELRKVLAEGDTLVCEGAVTYRRHDGSELTLPFCNVFELDGERIAAYKIYADVTPLFA